MSQFILTNHSGSGRSPTWASFSKRVMPTTFWRYRILNNVFSALRLFRERKNFEAVVLGGGAQIDFFYLLLQRIWPFNLKPVVKIDCLWYRQSNLKHFISKCLFKWLDKFVSCYVVWASREIADYASTFGLPIDKFIFIPYHTTVDLSTVTIQHNNYIFSGGNFARDYATLAKAIEGIKYEVVIACSNSEAIAGIEFPPNAKVGGVSHQEFMQLMAGSDINIIPLEKGLLHSGGQQSFLNAMLMGKPVIVTDPDGAKDYIEDGVDGLLVPPGDPEQLRNAILRVENDPSFAEKLGKAGKQKAVKLCTEYHFLLITKLTKKIVREQRK